MQSEILEIGNFFITHVVGAYKHQHARVWSLQYSHTYATNSEVDKLSVDAARVINAKRYGGQSLSKTGDWSAIYHIKSADEVDVPIPPTLSSIYPSSMVSPNVALWLPSSECKWQQMGICQPQLTVTIAELLGYNARLARPGSGRAGRHWARMSKKMV